MNILKWIFIPTSIFVGGKAMGTVLLPKEAKMNFKERCKQVGLDSENHFVTTEDGYVLQLFRIKSNEAQSTHPPVYLQHGLQASGMWWADNKEKSPSFVLAKNGYDVWIANSRGNIFSEKHVNLDCKKDKEYWDFSFEEMAKYDTKAVIDYILKNNEHKWEIILFYPSFRSNKVSYIGHSQGGAIMFVMLAEDWKWYQDKLSIGKDSLKLYTKLSKSS